MDFFHDEARLERLINERTKGRKVKISYCLPDGDIVYSVRGPGIYFPFTNFRKASMEISTEGHKMHDVWKEITKDYLSRAAMLGTAFTALFYGSGQASAEYLNIPLNAAITLEMSLIMGLVPVATYYWGKFQAGTAHISPKTFSKLYGSENLREIYEHIRSDGKKSAP